MLISVELLLFGLPTGTTLAISIFKFKDSVSRSGFRSFFNQQQYINMAAQFLQNKELFRTVFCCYIGR